MSGWADLTTALDEFRGWLETQLAGPKTYTDGAPKTPLGSYCVIADISQPRDGAPLAGLTNAGWQVQVTSVGWDATQKRSPAKAARYLGGKVCNVIAGTTATGALAVAGPTLTGLHVQSRETEGDGKTEKIGDVWQHVESFRIYVSAA